MPVGVAVDKLVGVSFGSGRERIEVYLDLSVAIQLDQRVGERLVSYTYLQRLDEFVANVGKKGLLRLHRGEKQEQATEKDMESFHFRTSIFDGTKLCNYFAIYLPSVAVEHEKNVYICRKITYKHFS